MRPEVAATTISAILRGKSVDPIIDGGDGYVEVKRAGDQSVVTRAAARSPLKLLVPRTHGKAAWIFAGTYGGGLVAGDSIKLDLNAATGTTTLLSTQASTKIYRSAGLPCCQKLHASLEDESMLVSLPDPIVCFANAIYRQRQWFQMAATANLISVDWFTSGRRARGERWAFDHYESTTEIVRDDRCILRDALVLSPLDGPLISRQRMGACDSFATLVLTGPILHDQVRDILKYVAAEPLNPHSPVQFSASPIPGGLVCRAAASETEVLGRWIHTRLEFVSELLGQDPWERKW